MTHAAVLEFVQKIEAGAVIVPDDVRTAIAKHVEGEPVAFRKDSFRVTVPGRPDKRRPRPHNQVKIRPVPAPAEDRTILTKSSTMTQQLITKMNAIIAGTMTAPRSLLHDIATECATDLFPDLPAVVARARFYETTEEGRAVAKAMRYATADAAEELAPVAKREMPDAMRSAVAEVRKAHPTMTSDAQAVAFIAESPSPAHREAWRAHRAADATAKSLSLPPAVYGTANARLVALADALVVASDGALAQTDARIMVWCNPANAGLIRAALAELPQ